MFVIVLVIGLMTAGVLFSFGTDINDRTTVTVDHGECTYTLPFDPQDVDGFSDEQAANDQYTDGSFPCVGWFDAGGADEFDEGEPVTEWTDKSANEHTARPTGEAPRWATVEGIQAVQFNGAGGLAVELDADSPELDAESGLTVTMLVYVENRTHHGGLYAISDASAGDNGAENSDPAVDLRQSAVAAENSQAGQWWPTPGPQSEITTERHWAIITHTVDADAGELFVNGDSQGETESELDELGGELQIGTAGSGMAFDGYVAEYFLTNERLSTGQRNLVECAMDDKHDSVVDLDAC